METENNNSIDFLDITIYRSNGLAIRFYRKPTATDHIIPHEYNHPLNTSYQISITFPTASFHTPYMT